MALPISRGGDMRSNHHRETGPIWLPRKIRDAHCTNQGALSPSLTQRSAGLDSGSGFWTTTGPPPSTTDPPVSPRNDWPGTKAGNQTWGNPNLSHHPSQGTYPLESASLGGNQEGHQDWNHRGGAGQYTSQVVPQDSGNLQTRVHQTKEDGGHVSTQECQLKTHTPWCTTFT